MASSSCLDLSAQKRALTPILCTYARTSHSARRSVKTGGHNTADGAVPEAMVCRLQTTRGAGHCLPRAAGGHGTRTPTASDTSRARLHCVRSSALQHRYRPAPKGQQSGFITAEHLASRASRLTRSTGVKTVWPSVTRTDTHSLSSDRSYGAILHSLYNR
ncbi:hypothetical protein MRX96_014506 [Rhipicephalus microplus]